ncbi:MAG: TonB-dependent receptor, partial [Pseudomonadota bacterium]
TDTLGLFQQPDLTYNAVVFYANEFFETRLSWNWTGEFLDTVGNTPDQDEFWDDRGQLDAQIRVNASENLSLVFEAVNLNDAGRTEVSGPNGDFLQEDARFGRTFWIGANVAF